ncbi:MAG: polysaccharide deacetylase family protein [Acidobacteria bacterium]|nr:polysaccharide deacetylase family protein [Acidobacteriota bacterium]
MSLRSQAAPAAKTALLRLGGYAACRTLFPSRKIAILRYHAVCDPWGNPYAHPGICVSPAAFESHVRYLAGHYAVLPLPEIVDRVRGGRPLPANTVAITFDDGYADNLDAARTLHRHGLSATFYITAGCLAGGQPFWPAEIRTLLRAVPGPVLTLSTGGTPVRIPLGTPEERRTAVRTVTKLLKGNPIPVREALRDQLREAAGDVQEPEYMLRWDELAEMHALGMTIGSHTLTHPNLPNAGVEAARQELTESKARLERELGAPVTMFSYPNGGADRYMTPAIAQVVRDTGYAAATTSRNAFATPASDLYALERVQVQERLEDLIFALEIERFLLKPMARPGEVE